MDSSRNGLLSTVIMTIPLVIVPAIALFRPPSQNIQVSTEELAGAEEEDFLSEFGLNEPVIPENADSQAEKRPSPDDPADVSDWFDSHNEGSTVIDDPVIDQSLKETPADGHANLQSDPFSTEPEGSSSEGSSPKPAATEQILLQQINELGAMRVHWFSASGDSPVGFAAFFESDAAEGQTTYRFEAVERSRLEALREVHRQASAWMSQSRVKPVSPRL